jgi:hypothetical protein
LKERIKFKAVIHPNFNSDILKMINLRSKSGPVPLGELLKREGVKSERIRERERCELVYGEWAQSKKGEDFTLIKPDCERVPGDVLSTFSVFAVRRYIYIYILCYCCYYLSFFFEISFLLA